MKSKTLAILTIIALCLSLASVLAPPLVSPAQAMETLHATAGPPTVIEFPNTRSVDLQPGDEIIQFTRDNLIVGTNPVGRYYTVGRIVQVLSGDLSGNQTGEFNEMLVTWDELGGMWKGFVIQTSTFDDGQGNTFRRIIVADLDQTSLGSNPTLNVSAVMTSGTGIFSGKIGISRGYGYADGTSSGTMRLYSGSEISGPYSVTSTTTGTPGCDFRAFGPSTGPNPDDEFIQFSEDNIVIPQGDPAGYAWGNASSSATGDPGAPTTGNGTHTYSNIIIPIPGPPNRGITLSKDTFSDASGTIRFVSVADYWDQNSYASYAYSFALRENNTGAYADKDFYQTSNSTAMAGYVTADTELYILAPSAPTPTPTPTPAPPVVVETPAGGNVTVSAPGSVMTFDTITVAGNTTVTTTSENPVGPTPSGFNVAGLFVDISTTAIYTGNVTLGISYDPSTPNPQNLRLFHYEGGHWADVTTWVDTTNHIVYGEVSSLSWFFIGGQWVWVETAPVPVFPSVYIGIMAALVAGVLAYFVRRRLVRQ